MAERRHISHGLWRDIWRQFMRHTGAVFGAGLFAIIVIAVLFGPLLWGLAPDAPDFAARNAGPSVAHPFGTDQLGRDLLAQVLAGGRISLAVGLTAMVLSVGLGTVVGVAAGVFRRLTGL